MAAIGKVNLNYLKVYCTDKIFSFAVWIDGVKCKSYYYLNKYDYTFLYIVFSQNALINIDELF